MPEWPAPDGFDIDWWAEATTKRTHSYCPLCEPDYQDVMGDPKPCSRHENSFCWGPEEESLAEQITAPYVAVAVSNVIPVE